MEGWWVIPQTGASVLLVKANGSAGNSKCAVHHRKGGACRLRAMAAGAYLLACQSLSSGRVDVGQRHDATADRDGCTAEAHAC